MIRFYSVTQYNDEKQMVMFACNSGDTKPTDGIATGSIALEANTGKMYSFDETAGTWTELA